MSEPKIYTRNYVDSESVFTLSHGGTPLYAYDRNAATRLVSTGANSDATTVDIEIAFYQGGVAQTRTIDTLALLNHNLKTWTLYRWDGAAYQSVTSQAADALANRVVSFTSFSATKVKLSCSATQTTNAEKAVGEIVLCALTLDVGSDMTGYDVRWRERAREVTLGDGSLHKVFMKDDSGRLGKYEATVRFDYISKATRDLLKAIRDTGQPFLWQPESVSVPEDLFLVHWASTWSDKYTATHKGAGYELAITVKEV